MHIVFGIEPILQLEKICIGICYFLNNRHLKRTYSIE